MSQEVIFTSEATAARRRVYFQLVDVADGLTPKTSITGAARISKNGATTAASSANIVEIDATNMPGRYYLEFAPGEVDTIGIVVVRFKTAATAEMVAQASVVNYDPYSAPSTTLDVADALLDRTDAIESGLTPRGAFRLISAVLFGKATGMTTTTATFRNAVADSKARITATVDADGDRTTITTDPT